MKKIICAIATVSILFSCGDKAAKPGPEAEKGFALISKSDCLTCHKIDEALIGPSYSSVANKYAGYSDTIVTHLANKIVSGGSGVWGPVPMAQHAGISMEDARLMVHYILSQKK
jgi:cytochrome c